MSSASGVRYVDCDGAVWTEVVAHDCAVFLEDENGERFTFAWVEDHFGPLEPEATLERITITVHDDGSVSGNCTDSEYAKAADVLRTGFRPICKHGGALIVTGGDCYADTPGKFHIECVIET